VAGLAVVVTLAFVAGPALRTYRLRCARQALARHRPDVALQWLEAADGGDRRSAEIQFLMGRAHRKLGNLSRLRECLEQAWRLGHPKDAIQREQWMAMAQSGQLAEAEPALKEHLARSGEDAQEICEALVNGHLRNYNFAAAASWLDAWQADFPEDAQPHYCQGRIRRHFMQLPQAAEAYAKALEMDPTRTDVRLELAETMEQQHRLDEALAHYRRCREERPVEPRALSGMARCLFGQGQRDEAEQVYRQVLARWPDDLEAQVGLARIELATGRAEEALRLLRPALERMPHDRKLRYSLAVALRTIGEHEEAERHFAFVREANEAAVRVQQLTDQLRMSPQLIEPRYEIGELLLQYGSSAEAVAWLSSVLQWDPHHRATHQALADYYAQHDNPQLAEQHRRQAEAHDEPPGEP
jgi:tetratricopeptide (TPR) repeat protein